MTDLRALLESHVADGTVPGAVALVARGDDIEVAAVGSVDVEGTAPMTRDSIFRLASITKPIVSAAALMLVEDGTFALTDPIARWLPELAAPNVVRTPRSPVGDVVPANRPITVLDVLTSRMGWGFPSDFSLPAVQPLFEEVQADGRNPQHFPPTGEWLAKLARIPMLYQPGEAWLYNTSYDVLGVLLARASGKSLADLLAERIFEPLGMTDSGFVVPEAQRGRFTSYYRAEDGELELADTPDGQWSTMPAFLSGAGGLAGTVDDWYRFARMLLAEGTVDGRRLLSAESVRQMLTNQLEPADREGAALFLEGHGWGFGGSVDIAETEPGNVVGRYGWVGGTGTSAHLVPGTGTVSILFTQVGVASPTPDKILRDFWAYAAR
ncbi:serine hydrolase domain-containing protein [Amycolatopsis sp.]|uniref:serine hydrolase domain-containing protein n=1 Tax=Amycolatopsis sp. TaxID=37632 RepID=UPI002CFC2269|nr:serine hydrolase domain-containing protein [Amycolatopsis sp.]HVV13442.1 serine hydrolase domain-containing protein [Amycolatopsis sp.]